MTLEAFTYVCFAMCVPVLIWCAQQLQLALSPEEVVVVSEVVETATRIINNEHVSTL